MTFIRDSSNAARSPSPMSSPSSAAAVIRHRHQHLRLPPPCPHLDSYRSSAASGALRSLHRCLLRRPPLGLPEVRRDPGEVPRCASCFLSSSSSRDDDNGGGTVIAPRLYACLVCAAVSCRMYAPDHASALPGHEISVDIDRAELFCAACGDQVYDHDFDAAVVIALTGASALFLTSSFRQASQAPDNRVLKRRRTMEYRPWVPDSKERAVIGRRSSPLACKKAPAVAMDHLTLWAPACN